MLALLLRDTIGACVSSHAPTVIIAVAHSAALRLGRLGVETTLVELSADGCARGDGVERDETAERGLHKWHPQCCCSVSDRVYQARSLFITRLHPHRGDVGSSRQRRRVQPT
jgi:hypothetical protein